MLISGHVHRFILRGQAAKFFITLSLLFFASSVLAQSSHFDPPTLPPLSGNGVSYELEEHGTQLLLRLSKPGEYAKRVRGLPWISYVNEGYDTLLIVAKPGYKIVVDDAGKTFHAVSEPTNESSKQAGQTKLRYDLLAARIDLESGDIYDATQKLNQMTVEHPKEMQVLSLAASAEGAGGNWPRAEELMASARALAPRDSDLLEAQREMLRLNAPNVTLDQEFIHLGSDRESVQTLSGYVNATADTQVGTVLQNNQIDTRKIRLSNGSSGAFSNMRQRGEVYAQWNSESGQLVKGSIFANDVAPGVGGYYSFLDAFGQTAITAEWNKPYWEYAQTVVDEGTRDRLAILQTIKPDNRLTISGGPGFNRYNVEHMTDVASGASVQTNVTYRLIDGEPFLDIGYGLDAEYVTHSEKTIDSTGALTRVLPITSHEIHAVVLGTGYKFSDHTYGTVDGGYAYDRLSGHGPLASAKLTEELTKAFDLQLHAMYGYSSASSGTNNTVTRFGASLRYRF
jgi:hypothetical protein